MGHVFCHQPPFLSYHLSSHSRQTQQLSQHRSPLAMLPGQSSTWGLWLPQPLLTSLYPFTLSYAPGQLIVPLLNHQPNAKPHLLPERFSDGAADGKKCLICLQFVVLVLCIMLLLKEEMGAVKTCSSCSFMGCEVLQSKGNIVSLLRIST